MAILMVVLAVASLGVWLARRHDRARVAAPQSGQYLCPMHLEVRSDVPSECPICGMALVKVGSLTRELIRGGEDAADTIAAAQILSGAASGMAPNLVGYYPSPLRRHVLRYEVLSPAWLEAGGDLRVLVYRDQLASLDPNERTSFTPTAAPGTVFTAVQAPGPPEPWDPALALVHFTLPSPGAAGSAPERGTVGWVKFPSRPRPVQVIPAGALLQSDQGPYVLVVSPAAGTAAKRTIEAGHILTGLVAVLSGLELREQVVSVNAFFWDAERRLQAARRAGSEGAP